MPKRRSKWDKSNDDLRDLMKRTDAEEDTELHGAIAFDWALEQLLCRKAKLIEQKKQLKNIRRNLSTRKKWSLDDYRDFYERDVKLLLALVTGKR